MGLRFTSIVIIGSREGSFRGEWRTEKYGEHSMVLDGAQWY
jgi:hypothetical protein